MEDRLGINLISFESTKASLTGSLSFGDSYPLFSGHFEGEPVLPGVSLIDTSIRLLRKLDSSISQNNIKINKCRFAQIVRPNDDLDVTGKELKPGRWKLQWTRTKDQKLVAQVDVSI